MTNLVCIQRIRWTVISCPWLRLGTDCPPNFLVALKPMSTGRKVNGALAKVIDSRNQTRHMGDTAQ